MLLSLDYSLSISYTHSHSMSSSVSSFFSFSRLRALTRLKLPPPVTTIMTAADCGMCEENYLRFPVPVGVPWTRRTRPNVACALRLLVRPKAACWAVGFRTIRRWTEVSGRPPSIRRRHRRRRSDTLGRTVWHCKQKMSDTTTKKKKPPVVRYSEGVVLLYYGRCETYSCCDDVPGCNPGCQNCEQSVKKNIRMRISNVIVEKNRRVAGKMMRKEDEKLRTRKPAQWEVGRG